MGQEPAYMTVHEINQYLAFCVGKQRCDLCEWVLGPTGRVDKDQRKGGPDECADFAYRFHKLTVEGLYLKALLRAMERCDGRDHLLVGGGALL